MPHETTTNPATALRLVREAYARTLAVGTVRYDWRTPIEGRVETSAHGHADLRTGTATMTSVTAAPAPTQPPAGEGVLVLDGLITLPGQSEPDELTAHALLVPQDGSLSMVLLSGGPSQDERGNWTGRRSSAPSLAMEVDPVLGSVAGTFHWLAAVTAAEPDEAGGRYRVELDLAELVAGADEHRREAVRLTLDQLQLGLSERSATGIVEIDPATGFVTSFSVGGGTSDDGIDPVLLELRDHGVPVEIVAPLSE